MENLETNVILNRIELLLSNFFDREIGMPAIPNTNTKLRIILSDSIQALKFVTFIEDEFDIEFDDDEVDLYFFSDVQCITERISANLEKKRQAKLSYP